MYELKTSSGQFQASEIVRLVTYFCMEVHIKIVHIIHWCSGVAKVEGATTALHLSSARQSEELLASGQVAVYVVPKSQSTEPFFFLTCLNCLKNFYSGLGYYCCIYSSSKTEG